MGRTLLEHIKHFNCKERFLLIQHVLPAAQPLAETFIAEINALLGTALTPSDYWCIDYHLDWLYAALTLHAGDLADDAQIEIDDRCFKASQEDIDLLLVSTRGAQTDLVLVEAKATTGWTNKQLRSKADRFGAIFGDDGRRWPGVQPHFVLMSPRRPGRRLGTTAWPTWMRSYHWIALQPEHPTYGQLSRCNDQRQADEHGQSWTVFHRHYRARERQRRTSVKT